MTKFSYVCLPLGPFLRLSVCSLSVCICWDVNTSRCARLSSRLFLASLSSSPQSSVLIVRVVVVVSLSIVRLSPIDCSGQAGSSPRAPRAIVSSNYPLAAMLL